MQSELPALPVTPQAMVSELRRELKMRARVYLRWVASNQLSQSDADHRIRVLDQAQAEIERVHADALRPAQAHLLA